MSEPEDFLQYRESRLQEIERRAAVRYQCEFRTACHPVPFGDEPAPALVQDISVTGIALLVDRYFEPETLLEVDLTHEEVGLSYTLLVQVMHSHQVEEGCWRLGCSFARELSQDELNGLL